MLLSRAWPFSGGATVFFCFILRSAANPFLCLQKLPPPVSWLLLSTFLDHSLSLLSHMTLPPLSALSHGIFPMPRGAFVVSQDVSIPVDPCQPSGTTCRAVEETTIIYGLQQKGLEEDNQKGFEQ
jgi:hypothetical protein